MHKNFAIKLWKGIERNRIERSSLREFKDVEKKNAVKLMKQF
jgi:hypothetical protein